MAGSHFQALESVEGEAKVREEDAPASGGISFAVNLNFKSMMLGLCRVQLLFVTTTTNHIDPSNFGVANVMGKPYKVIFHEFSGGSANPEDVGGSARPNGYWTSLRSGPQNCGKGGWVV